MTTELQHTSATLLNKKPEFLQRLFMVVGGISIAIILFSSAWGFRQVFIGYVVKMAESDAVAICRLMLDFEQEHILHRSNKPQFVHVSPDETAHLDTALAPIMRNFNVTKVKIFDHEHRIVYSTDKNIIGRVDSNNPRLLRALSGTIDSKLKEKKVGDLPEERLLTTKVVETYIPIRNKTDQVVGSFEIYLLTGKYDQAVRRGILLALLIMAVVLPGTFVASYLIIGQSVRQVKDAHELLQRIAITDALTGVANHGYLISRAKEEFERARRSYGSAGGKGLGCILLDLDHFKQINDTYGHLVGDQVLQKFVRRIELIHRPYDILGRYGGEEFLILLPETSHGETCAIAARILEAVRQEPFDSDAGPLTITASAGAATCTSTDQCLEDLLKRTDGNLYCAKRSGRDQVSCGASPLQTT